MHEKRQSESRKKIPSLINGKGLPQYPIIRYQYIIFFIDSATKLMLLLIGVESLAVIKKNIEPHMYCFSC